MPIQKAKEMGTLYVVSTPIGNLEDITLRALRILKEVDLIAAEGVEHSKGLCRHYGIRTKLVSCHQHNQKTRVPELLGKLRAGLDIAMITDAGTPGVSDPGVQLMGQALMEGIPMSPIPGPSAVTAALSVSGMRGDRFLFLGFLSNRPGKRRKTLEKLRHEPYTLVFLEAPHRLKATIKDILEILGDRQMVLLRELTKVYEEIIRNRVSAILDHVSQGPVRGEITLIVEESQEEPPESRLTQEGKRKMEVLLQEGRMSLKDAAAQISHEEGISYRRAYKACLALKKEKNESRCQRRPL